MNKRVVSAAMITAATLLVAGCGDTTGQSSGTQPSGTQSSGTQSSREQGRNRQPAPADSFNRADIEFVRGMIPHHRQAVKMADMVAGRTDNQRLLDLANRIRTAQQREIETLTGWLRKWKGPDAVPTEPMRSTKDTGMKGMGMMSHEDMAELRSKHGSAFDEMWLRMMIEHHEGAIEMARTELERGRHDGARKLAGDIIEAQQAEIAEMTAMLRS